MNYQERYKEWLDSEVFDEETKTELRAIANDDKEIEDRFYKDLKFGTGGLRGVIGAGTNRMNIYTVTKATQGLANYIRSLGDEAISKGVALAYDSRNMSPEFAEATALCLNANGIKTYIFDSLRPTPELSYAVRKLNCVAGVVITASHNPPEYNGYKVYWEDGAQITPPHDKNILAHVAEVTDFDQVLKMNLADAKEQGLYNMVPDSVDEDYYNELVQQTIHSDIIPKIADDMTIVFTPLHGTGNVPVQEVLKRLGFTKVYIVPEQEQPDGDFPTVASPNPENPEGFAMALALAKKVDADIVMATDPDADRLGIYVKDTNGVFEGTELANTDDYPYVCFNANMTGALVAEYVCRERKNTGTLPANGALCSTIVSTNLAAAIAKAYDLKFIETLTGFKYIGEQIKFFDENHSYKFIYGMEESYGCLVGDYTRDKDACGAVVMLSEVAAFYKTQGKTLCDAMEEIYEKYGYYREGAHSLTLKGADGEARIKEIMNNLRSNPITEVAGLKVVALRDYKEDRRVDFESKVETATGLPRSNVLYFELDKDGWFAVRPSGTEPKIKFYFGVNEATMKDANDKLAEIKRFVVTLA
ncbi:MAG: phospho-sugar mutase [Lachnospiraceae bacterium]|nr:phospho-sugar mutase [Lachnospiraceae bacterium]